jgi:proline iminopeptidase
MTADEFTNQEFYLDVGDGHELYVQDWGNPEAAIPVIFIHGGPGLGSSDKYKKYFNPGRQRVIFHDQRGSGRSRPYGSLEDNTTKHLVDDIKRLVEHLNINKFVLTGGSWGSCLALNYALAHPEGIKSMVLRGVFTGSQAETNWLDKGEYRGIFPDVWEAYLKRTPAAHRHNPTAYHFKQIVSGGPEAKKRSAYAYEVMEYSMMSLDDRRTPEAYDDYDPAGISIEMHYMANKCFIADEYVLKNASKLKMPVWLVQGRYDTICPPFGAYNLSRKLPNGHLLWTIAGHSGSDRANFDLVKSLLLQATEPD